MPSEIRKNNEFKKYLDLAFKLAETSQCKVRKVGSIIVKNDKIIGKGVNRLPDRVDRCWCNYYNNPVQPGPEHPSCLALHAEQVALFQAINIGVVNGVTLFSTHCPCLQCAKFIIEFQFTRVVYKHEYINILGKDFLRDNLDLVQYTK